MGASSSASSSAARPPRHCLLLSPRQRGGRFAHHSLVDSHCGCCYQRCGEDAQQFFDAWYQAEWAAATMPSYDAAYNGANSIGGGGVSLGLDSLGSLGGVFNSVSNGPGSSGVSVGQGLW